MLIHNRTPICSTTIPSLGGMILANTRALPICLLEIITPIGTIRANMMIVFMIVSHLIMLSKNESYSSCFYHVNLN